MLRKLLARVLIGAAAISLSLTIAVPAATAATEPALAPETAQQTVLRYDASGAQEFTQAVEAGVDVWNSSVANVALVPAGSGERAEIVIVADDGWPRAHLGPVRPGGQVMVWMGRQAVDEGYDEVRIAAHELGHSFGLLDDRTAPCSALMSGSAGGVGCTNAIPDAAERAQVEANYGTGPASLKPADGTLIVDRS